MDYKKYLNLIISNEADLRRNLLSLIEGKKDIGKDIFVGEGVIMEPNLFFDTSKGQIVIGDRTLVKANAILRGPLSVGRDCVINSFAEISTSQIGDMCKVGGEVHGSIIAGYSNKQHTGSLGHSYVGKWVNIGGGTSVSDLKNTYGTIKVKGEDTGQQFLGCIIGDYAKTAINTSIFCGKVIGEGAHVYGMVTEDVPAFTSYVNGEMYELPLDVAEKIQTAMMKRRGMEYGEGDHQNFIQMFQDTEGERVNAGVTKDKLHF